MFNYTHSVICNSADALEQAVAHLVDATGAKLPIVKAAYLEEGVDGVPAKYDCATAPDPLASGTALGHRIYIKLVSPMRELVEFASPNWQEFSKGIMVEVKAAATAADIAESLKLAIEGLDSKPFSVDASAVITMCDPRVQAIVSVDEYGVDGDKEIASDPKDVADSNNAVFPKFDYEWMCANVAFPTHLNMRYYAPNDMPVPGAKYDCYTVTLASKRPGLGGLSAVGQNVESKTKAVFYVNHDVTLGAKANAVLGSAAANIIDKTTVAAKDAADAAIDANS